MTETPRVPSSSRAALSVLDLAPSSEGMSRKDALDAALDLAVVADRAGYKRYWMAEHHGSTAFLSSATSLLLTRAAEHTSRIRLGSGGVMLPNHTPLMVAEYYGTLAEIYGDRIDLGLGRAPGTDPITARALRRGSAELRDFTRDVCEISAYFHPEDEGEAQQTVSGAEASILGIPYRPKIKRTRVRAIPGEGMPVSMWILSSSTAGSQVAAELGLPYSFASHFAPAAMKDALENYRANFSTRSRWAQIDKPYIQAGVSVMVAPTHEEAVKLASSARRLKLDIKHGMPSMLKKPSEELLSHTPALHLVEPAGTPSYDIVGTAKEVAQQLQAIVDYWKLDELIVISWTWDPKMRERSYELLAQEWF